MRKKDKMPPRCVLNDIQLVDIPVELDNLSKQFIQCAKAFQTIIRLGTYSYKVPSYNSLKACKGNIYFLPLPLSKTMETLGNALHTLADPELYIIVNGQPTKNRVVWCSLVDVNAIKAAVQKLGEINWLYRDVEEEEVDSAVKKVVHVVSKASCTMLERADDTDVSKFQYYIIQNLNNKLTTTSDIEQYKLLHVKEEPLNNRQKHHDVMYFPVLFPDGNFGEFHPMEEKLSSAEYVKCCLLNKDSRFRKLSQNMYKELKSGVYNVLNSTKTKLILVKTLLHGAQISSEHLEANLSTMLQSVRGTAQF